MRLLLAAILFFGILGIISKACESPSYTDKPSWQEMQDDKVRKQNAEWRRGICKEFDC